MLDWPALQATKRDVNELLKAGTEETAALRTGKIQWLLVLVQITFSVVILTQSGVLLNFSYRLQRVQLPFDPGKVLTAQVRMLPQRTTTQFSLMDWSVIWRPCRACNLSRCQARILLREVETPN